MKIVTSSSRYIDIDGYASCIAYSKLLNLKGIESKAVSTTKFNESITNSLLNLNVKLDKYEAKEDDEYIIVDVSHKNFLDFIVKEEKIIEILDHHAGYEKYWRDKLGDKSKIEFIGAVATIIIEEYEKENLLEKMDEEVAYLLMAAILDNTLDFQAKITTNRDIDAYKKLEKIVKNSKEFREKYFSECQKTIEENLIESIKNDTKIEKINNIIPNIFSQLLIWKKDNILKNQELIYSTLSEYGNEWIMNLICLKEGKSYIISNNPEVKEKMENLMNFKFNKDIMTLPEVWLRKEIIRKSFEM